MSTLLPSRAAIRIVPVVALVLALGTSALGSSPVSATVLVTRQSGADATGTAVAISQAIFTPGVAVVYMAAVGDAPYALPATAAAGALRGPVLLTTKDTLPAAVGIELGRLHPARIVAVGDTSHISDAVVTKLASYAPTVTRQAGADRFSTAAAVSAAAFAPGAPVAYVARYDDYPTMLAAAAAAGALGGPLLLTNQNTLTSVTATELARLRPGRIVVAGPTSAVSDIVLTALGTYAAGKVSRQAGADRYATAAAIAQGAYPANADLAFVASGTNFADGMTGAAAAAMRHRPLVLTDAITASAPTKVELAREAPQALLV